MVYLLNKLSIISHAFLGPDWIENADDRPSTSAYIVFLVPILSRGPQRSRKWLLAPPLKLNTGFHICHF